MNWNIVKVIWKKEIKDAVRDRRTLLSMVIIPIFLMPAIFIGVSEFMKEQTKKQQEKTIKMAIVGEENAPQIFTALKDDKKTQIVDAPEDFYAAVASEEIDAAIVIPEDFSSKIADWEPSAIEFYSKSTNSDATNIRALAQASVNEYNNSLLKERFAEKRVDGSVLSGAVLEMKDAASKKETKGLILSLIIPIFIVMHALTGGQYLAIDVSAGEKERKTLEALFLSPARRVEIVLGKFLAVASMALLSIILVIGSLYVTFLYFVARLKDLTALELSSTSSNVDAPEESFSSLMSGFNLGIDAQAIVLMVIISVLLVATFSAVLLSISIAAKSFKEAQNYLSYAYLLIIMPVILVNSIPSFEPALWHFSVPALNAIFLFREILMGTYNAAHIGVSLVSLSLSSAIAILAATRIYSKESALFGN